MTGTQRQWGILERLSMFVLRFMGIRHLGGIWYNTYIGGFLFCVYEAEHLRL